MHLSNKQWLFALNIVFIFLIAISFVGYMTDYINESLSKIYILGFMFVWIVLRELVKQNN